MDFLGFITEHFIELLLIVGFAICSVVFKLYKQKKCYIIYSISFVSTILMILDGLLKNNVLKGSYIPLLFLVLFNCFLCSLVVFPIKRWIHFSLLIPFLCCLILSFIVDELIQPIIALVAIIYFAIILIYTIIIHIVKKEIFESAIIETFSIINICCCLLQTIYPKTILVNQVILISTLSVFIIFVVKNNNEAKVDEEKRIQTQRTSIAISQIQPHFLYNSLATIGYICKKDPIKASEAIDKFSDYLRANLNSLRNEHNIPFKEELKHVETYLWLEKLRFDERLIIVYDIAVDNFLVPPLSVQPLVENAVKHGICEKLEGGILYIRTVDYNDKVKIIIEDTGVGFDVKSKPNDGKTHVGIENVGARIKNMANGELDIKSEIGKGTISTITLPKESI